MWKKTSQRPRNRRNQTKSNDKTNGNCQEEERS